MSNSSLNYEISQTLTHIADLNQSVSSESDADKPDAELERSKQSLSTECGCRVDDTLFDAAKDAELSGTSAISQNGGGVTYDDALNPFSEASAENSASEEAIKTGSAIRHVEFSSASPSSVRNVEAFSYTLENAKTVSLDFNAEAYLESNLSPIKNTDTYKADIAGRKNSDLNENLLQDNADRTYCDSRYVLVQSLASVGGGDADVPADNTVDVKIDQSETLCSERRDASSDLVEITMNDVRRSPVTAGGDTVGRKTEITHLPAEYRPVLHPLCAGGEDPGRGPVVPREEQGTAYDARASPKRDYDEGLFVSMSS